MAEAVVRRAAQRRRQRQRQRGGGLSVAEKREAQRVGGRQGSHRGGRCRRLFCKFVGPFIFLVSWMNPRPPPCNVEQTGTAPRPQVWKRFLTGNARRGSSPHPKIMAKKCQRGCWNEASKDAQIVWLKCNKNWNVRVTSGPLWLHGEIFRRSGKTNQQ